MLQNLVIVKFKLHVNFLENLTLITFANVQLMEKELKESLMNKPNNVSAHLTYHYGMVNFVLPVQKAPNLMINKNNVITVQKDLSEILLHTHVFQDFDHD